ncbi:ferroportin-like [Saccoglossus kowalevskii]|uniref:Solute carrier family 40 member n=1 Tax=Saccoglossus kowalevskii TaxID=10224 RepID=A0ABM0H044_SACKO|nr:PREDICTED: solute carrier family 40 member 1-like [Saccoglossus kowalevskii]
MADGDAGEGTLSSNNPDSNSEQTPDQGSILEPDSDVLLPDTLSVRDKDETSSYRAAGCIKYLKSPAFMIYCCQVLSSWGYRMWRFAIGLYLVEIAMDSLRLTAIYGLILCISSLMFSPLVGDWVDRTKRIRAIRIAIFLQNCCLVLCSLLLAMILVLEGNIKLIWNGVLFIMVEIMIIVLGDCANLAGEAERISIQKDWVVVVAGTNKSKLANLNAVLLRIDLVINIVAPIAIGSIMTYGSMLIGALVIAAWNLIAGCVEYYLMSTVYKAVPALRIKKPTAMNEEAVHADEKVNINQNTSTTPGDMMFSVGSDSEPSDAEINVSREDLSNQPTQGNIQEANVAPIRDTEQIKQENWKKVLKAFGLCITLGEGWKTYMSYAVWSAGVGLAFLYMTVLGFDSISTGYAYSQGLAEWLIGVLMGLGSVFGLLGTALFPRLREKIGLQRTGLWALIMEISCLSLCVISVWAPGSPFDLHPQNGEDFIANVSTTVPTTLLASNTSELIDITQDIRDKPDSYASVALLFTGMVLSRTGLWLFDLTVTQLIQESVLETQRGIFNGVQNSLNGFMDLVHFALVITFPNPHTYGVLVLLSFLFVCTGAGFFAYYSYKIRGHLFHCVKCTSTSNSYTIQESEASSV